MNPLVFWTSSDLDVSSPSRATRSPPRRRWPATAGQSTTGRCQSPTSRSLLKASSRSIPTPCSSTRPWWGRRCPTHTPPPWWSNRSQETSLTIQVRDFKKCCWCLCVTSVYSGESHEATATFSFCCQSVIISGMREDMGGGGGVYWVCPLLGQWIWLSRVSASVTISCGALIETKGEGRGVGGFGLVTIQNPPSHACPLPLVRE